MIRYLFVVKGGDTPHSLSDSARSSVEFLQSINIESKIISIEDYTLIEDEVLNYKPTHVVIESIFIVPIHFLRLFTMFKGVKWFIRIHSDIGFFFAEVYGLEWLHAYQSLSNENSNLQIVANNKLFAENISAITKQKVDYLPNLYTLNKKDITFKEDSATVNIGCFGALRLLKNQGFQALAAMHFGNKLNKTINFHINVSKKDLQKNSVLVNMRQLFKNTNHNLIEHGWLNHDEFFKLIETMDLGMQLSFTESFNLVTCDFITNNVPILVSKNIDWAPGNYYSSTYSIDTVVGNLNHLYDIRNNEFLLKMAYNKLYDLIEENKAEWIKFINKYNNI